MDRIIIIFFVLSSFGCCFEDPFDKENVFECPSKTSLRCIKSSGGKFILDDVHLFGKKVTDEITMMYNCDINKGSVISYGFEVKSNSYIIDSLINSDTSSFQNEQQAIMKLNIVKENCLYSCSLRNDSIDILTCWHQF